jgi:hypothetical protein
MRSPAGAEPVAGKSGYWLSHIDHIDGVQAIRLKMRYAFAANQRPAAS